MDAFLELCAFELDPARADRLQIARAEDPRSNRLQIASQAGPVSNRLQVALQPGCSAVPVNRTANLQDWRLHRVGCLTLWCRSAYQLLLSAAWHSLVPLGLRAFGAGRIEMSFAPFAL